MNDVKNKCRDAIMGFVVGDALGVPVEFVSREKLRDNPVTGMLGGKPIISRRVPSRMIPVCPLRQ